MEFALSRFIWRHIKAIFLAVVGGIAGLLTLDGGKMIGYYCTPGSPAFVFDATISLQGAPYCSVSLISGTILLPALVAVIGFLIFSVLVDLIGFLYKRFISWINKDPNPKNIYLSPGITRGNILTLKFRCNEWRYFFRKLIVQVSTNYTTLEDSGFGDEAFFDISSTSTSMRTWKDYEFDYVQFDLINKLFWYKQKDMDHKKFRIPGILKRTIYVTIGVQTKTGYKLATQKFYVETIHNGRKITARIHEGKVPRHSDNSENAEEEVKEPSILIEPPSTMRGPAVYPFVVTNQGSQKLTGCYAKLEAAEMHFDSDPASFQNKPPIIYPDKILWQSKSETIELRPNDPNYLNVLELGKHHFRFLFFGDKPLSAGEFEPENLTREQRLWLSHTKYMIRITLFGDDKDGVSWEIQKEFALIFMVLDNEYTRNVVKVKPLSSCAMKIREMTSQNDVERYFKW